MLQVGTRFFLPSNEFELEPETRVVLVLASPSDETGVEVDGVVVDTDPWCIDDGFAELFAGLGSEGFGHVMSAARVDLQCIRMFSYKYHCPVRSSPGMRVLPG